LVQEDVAAQQVAPNRIQENVQKKLQRQYIKKHRDHKWF